MKPDKHPDQCPVQINSTNTKLSLLRKFLETTSIKGVPRTLSSRGACFRVLWGSAVILGFLAASYFLFGLFSLYLSNSTTISIHQIRDGGHTFPSVTLCNLNILSNIDFKESDIYELYQLRYSENITWSTQQLQYLEVLVSPASIFENLIYGKLNERTRHFIVACRWHEGFLYDEDTCMGSSQRVVYATDRGYCYTFRPPSQLSGISGFSAIVYIDNTVDVLLPAYDMSVAAPFSLGALVALHPHTVPPNLGKAIALEVGYDTSVHLIKSRTLRTETPESKCVHWKHPERLYDRDACLRACFKQNIIDKCGCIDGRFGTTGHSHDNMRFCKDMKQPNTSLHDFIERMQCLEQSISQPWVCDVECPEKCVDEDIKLSTSKVPWPHPSYQLSLYNSYVRDQPYEGRFHYYKNVAHIALTNPNRAFNMLEHPPLEQPPLLEKNFLQVSWHPYI